MEFFNEFNTAFRLAHTATVYVTPFNMKKKGKNLSVARDLTHDLEMHCAQAKHWLQLVKETSPSTVTFCFDIQ